MNPDLTPDWKDAPEWANWLAMDANGEWYWYKNKPEPELDRGVFYSSEGKVELAGVDNWLNSVQQRPKP